MDSDRRAVAPFVMSGLYVLARQTAKYLIFHPSVVVRLLKAYK